jgi:predicted O-methyltransferase YrrM
MNIIDIDIEKNYKSELICKKMLDKNIESNIIKKFYNYSILFNKVIVSLSRNNSIYYIKLIRYFALRFYKESPLLNYMLYLFKINNYIIYEIQNNNMSIVEKNIVNNSKKLHVFIGNKEIFNKIHNNMQSCKYAILHYNISITWLKYILSILKNGDSTVFYASNYCTDYFINLYYILILIFEKVYILNGRVFICLNYNNKSEYIKNIKEFDNNKNEYLYIEPKPNLNKLINNLNNTFIIYIKLYKLILTNNDEKIFSGIYDFYLSCSKNKIIKKYDHKKIYHQYLNTFFVEISRRLLLKKDNNNNIIKKQYKFHSLIKKEEGKNIQNIIKEYKLKNCLELGLSYGIYAFYILTTNKTVKLTSIDNTQKDSNFSDYLGLKLIKELNLDNRHKFIEELSYIALPKLLIEKNIYDFIFIDSWYNYENIYNNFFYIDKLLNINGIILIDNSTDSDVKKFIKYIEKKYSNYVKIESIKNQCAFIKNSLLN